MIDPKELKSCIVVQHKKGGIYLINDVNILHTETKEKLVIYMNSDREKFARPMDMFCDGRFKIIGYSSYDWLVALGQISKKDA